jgi:hypothetical protein
VEEVHKCHCTLVFELWETNSLQVKRRIIELLLGIKHAVACLHLCFTPVWDRGHGDEFLLWLSRPLNFKGWHGQHCPQKIKKKKYNFRFLYPILAGKQSASAVIFHFSTR